MTTDSDKTDMAVAIGKGIIGGCPLVGPLVAEVVGHLIPNQRIDRIGRFVQALEAKLQSIERALVEAAFARPGFVDLLEDGFWQAARALSDERLEHIATLVKNGLTEEQIEDIGSKKLLQLLGELNDVEVVILNYHPLLGEDRKAYWRKHEAALNPPVPHMVSSPEERDRSTLGESYRAHLVRLGLLRRGFDPVRDGESPEFDDTTGMMKAHGYESTSLGRLLLRHLDLIDERCQSIQQSE